MQLRMSLTEYPIPHPFITHFLIPRENRERGCTQEVEESAYFGDDMPVGGAFHLCQVLEKFFPRSLVPYELTWPTSIISSVTIWAAMCINRKFYPHHYSIPYLCNVQAREGVKGEGKK